MDKNTANGCGIGCGIILGVLLIDYLFIIGLIWLMAWCFSPWGVVFDIRIATGIWLILHILIWAFSSSKD